MERKGQKCLLASCKASPHRLIDWGGVVRDRENCSQQQNVAPQECCFPTYALGSLMIPDRIHPGGGADSPSWYQAWLIPDYNYSSRQTRRLRVAPSYLKFSKRIISPLVSSICG